jgi:hypothetical protein
MRPVRTLLTLLLLAATQAAALDQPLSARKLVMRRTASGQEKLAFLAKDPAILFPAIGSADDPANGTPGGALIEIFSANEGPSALAIPAAVGWFVRDGSPSYYKFVNKLAPQGVSPVSSFLLKNERALRIRSGAIGLPMNGPLGPVGIRVTYGSLRVCALFDEETIRRDGSRVFLAKDAVATDLADCSNASLGGPTCAENGDAPTCGGTCPPGSACGSPDLLACQCIPANQPCGGTAPVCNGECPVGEVCGSTGGLPYPGCGCIPAASGMACGETYPQCGGACPTGLGCFGVSFSFGGTTINGCQCLTGPPVDPCGGCPPGFQCFAGPGLPPICLAFCGTSPACGGTCPTGTSCTDTSGLCLCL